MNLELLKRLAHGIAAQFGENCEVLVHDLRGEDVAHTIAAIENGHVSHRQTGGGASRAALEALQRRDDPTLVDELGYLAKTSDGRILQSSTMYLRDDDGIIEGVLSINYDISELLIAERAITSLLNRDKAPLRSPERIPANVNDLLDDLIEQSVALAGKPVAMMSKEDKINAIQFLSQSGAFLVTKSGDKISKYFGISKYTLYSYIDANKEQGKD